MEFTSPIALAKWILANEPDELKQEQLMAQGVNSQVQGTYFLIV